ncbi:hypothetical protein LPTSP3_g32290 [Leptospira kobayashii]|uniref:Uncharacterized protein n=1 Tax=Leptospira kobayashii TaxID=1917830 RepID=A0ABM7UMJ7_9LEPT|nr:hypothetical protein LPTSP3_g32290 [Leptospira kobayashii]
MSEIHGKYGPDGNNTADKTPDGKFNGKSDSNYNFESNIKNVNVITIFSYPSDFSLTDSK